MLHLKVFFLELAQSGYQGPEFTCPDHDSTSTGTIGTCLLQSPVPNFDSLIWIILPGPPVFWPKFSRIEIQTSLEKLYQSTIVVQEIPNLCFTNSCYEYPEVGEKKDWFKG